MHDRLPLDILVLIFHHFVADSQTLAHNNGRLPEYEHNDDDFAVPLRVVMADFEDNYRPRNLVSRQRAFLRLMIDRPELATHVQAFTWTMVWLDFDEEALTDIDLQLWDVFERMKNVSRLDLASLREREERDMSDEPYIRQFPPTLFPAVTDLRLVGWMHRGLVKTILSSLKTENLCSLTLDHLQDEGALPGPDGKPLPEFVARMYRHRGSDADVGVDDELWARQERGEAVIFPGPMWFPLRFLRQYRLSSFTMLHVKFGPFDTMVDKRNYVAMFHQTAEFIRSVKDTLKDISIELAEKPILHDPIEVTHAHHICGTSRLRVPQYRSRCALITTTFMYRLLAVLTEEKYTHLKQVDLKGFSSLREKPPNLTQPPNHQLTLERIDACPFVDRSCLDTENVDYRTPFEGYLHPFTLQNMDQNERAQLEDALERS
ncbi:hypothetical protein E8E14_010152 [Neopestalotiopsis sp. 37M]|nr:hypothetical protein E8E14_010152 [Neopestalotiopsis sp. 37M]